MTTYKTFHFLQCGNKKDHDYLIPKTKVDRYGDSEVYFNLSEESLKEFEI